MSNLAKSSSASLVTAKPLSKTHKLLVGLLDLAAKATNYEMASGELRLWEPLTRYSEGELQEAFQCYFQSAQCGFFPRPGQITAIIAENQSKRGVERKWAETSEQIAENRKARESGNTVSFAEIQQRFAEICKEKALEK